MPGGPSAACGGPFRGGQGRARWPRLGPSSGLPGPATCPSPARIAPGDRLSAPVPGMAARIAPGDRQAACAVVSGAAKVRGPVGRARPEGLSARRPPRSVARAGLTFPGRKSGHRARAGRDPGEGRASAIRPDAREGISGPPRRVDPEAGYPAARGRRAGERSPTRCRGLPTGSKVGPVLPRRASGHLRAGHPAAAGHAWRRVRRRPCEPCTSPRRTPRDPQHVDKGADSVEKPPRLWTRLRRAGGRSVHRRPPGRGRIRVAPRVRPRAWSSVHRQARTRPTFRARPSTRIARSSTEAGSTLHEALSPRSTP